MENPEGGDGDLDMYWNIVQQTKGTPATLKEATGCTMILCLDGGSAERPSVWLSPDEGRGSDAGPTGPGPLLTPILAMLTRVKGQWKHCDTSTGFIVSGHTWTHGGHTTGDTRAHSGGTSPSADLRESRWDHWR